MLKVYIYRIAYLVRSNTNYENLFVIAESKKEADQLARNEEMRAEGLWTIQKKGFLGFKQVKKGMVITPFNAKSKKRKSHIFKK